MESSSKDFPDDVDIFISWADVEQTPGSTSSSRFLSLASMNLIGIEIFDLGFVE